MDDTRTRIIQAAIKGVRNYGLEGVRIQNISALAGLSPGAMYRYFPSKDELIVACFTWVDMQVAKLFEGVTVDRKAMLDDPIGSVEKLWRPYFRFWTARPDETVFYHRFRDSSMFPAYDKQRNTSYFKSFIVSSKRFMATFPALRRINQDILWLHVLNGTVTYAKYVVEGVLPNTEATENDIFQLLTTGLAGYLKPKEEM